MNISNNKKKEIPYISVKACPICGEHPEKVRESLERPGGHGYQGCFSYEYKCECCKLLRGGETTDIYVSPEEAVNLAKELWNEKVDSAAKYIDRIYVPRTLVENNVI